MIGLVILVGILALCVGFIAGICACYWWMNREWRNNPYVFKTILEAVIARREGHI